MKPVMQTVFSDPLKNIWGNCFNACLASLLEMPIEQIPDFGAGDPSKEDQWLPKTNDWLRQFGLAYIEFNSIPAPTYRDFNIEVHHIIVGPSPRNKGMHAVIGKGGRIVHDPHPDGTGLLDGPWLHGMLLSLRPDIAAKFIQVPIIN